MSERLTDGDRAQLERNLETLVSKGDAVGEWWSTTVTARRKSFTMTVKFGSEVDPFVAEEFARLMCELPALVPPIIRRLLGLDAEAATP